MNCAEPRPQRVLRLGTYPHPTPLPLSYLQRWWWELEQLAGATPQLLLVIPLKGPTKRTALERALAELRRRHEALRTRFVATNSSAIAIVDPPSPADGFLEFEDYSALGQKAGTAEATELADQYRLQSFELDGGCLFRACLIKLTDHFNLLLIGLHHILFDAWSGAILKSELSVLYRAYCEGKASPLDEPRIQLTDLTIWEQHWIEASGRSDPYAFWEQRLGEAQPLLLPTDWPRRADGGGSPEATSAIELPGETVSALRRMCLNQDATVPAALLAIYGMLIWRWSGRTDVLLGCYMACRFPPGVERLIGCLAANRPVYSVISPELSFATYLARVRAAYSDALDMKNPISFRMSWQTHLHAIVANFWKATQPPPERAPQFQARPTLVHHDLSLSLLELPDLIRGWVSYAAERFSPATLAAFCCDFRITAHAVANDPQLTVARATQHVSLGGCERPDRMDIE